MRIKIDTDINKVKELVTDNGIYSTSVASVYPFYVAKAERKGRTKAEVDELAKGKAMEKILLRRFLD